MRRIALWLVWLVGGILALSLVAAAAVVVLARGSLPPTNGEGPLAGLSAPAVLERDSLGIAVIRAGTLRDAYRLQGFAHGQDRFFQMDLLRRYVSGELSALVGAEALSSDQKMRRFQYRTAAREHLSRLDPTAVADLTAYVEGVNAGLQSLRRKPPEYTLLRADPASWTPEDAILSFLYFYVALSTHHEEEAAIFRMAQRLPEPWVAFLTPEASRFDQPLLGLGETDARGGYEPLAIPGPEVLNLREAWAGGDGPSGSAGASGSARPSGTLRPLDLNALKTRIQIFGDLVERAPETLPGGSNAWAVRGLGGPALVAGDPHLAHQVPGVWYRVEFHWPGGVARGVSPPGLPGVFLGMTDHIAWSVTAAMVDQTDLALVTDATPIERHVEWIQVHRGDSVALEVARTPWGPVVYEAADLAVNGGYGTNGAPDSAVLPGGAGLPGSLALRSPAYDPGGVTLVHLELLELTTVEQAIDMGRRFGGPTLGLVFGDATGRTAWMVSGVIPQRVGHDGRRAVVPTVEAGAGSGATSSASASTAFIGWNGARPESERPTLVDPDHGYVFTANQRFGDMALTRSLSGFWVSPTRARRLQSLLEVDARPDEDIHFAYQLDTRSLEHEELRAILLDLIPQGETTPVLQALRQAAEGWNGNADADNVAFAQLERARLILRAAALGPVLASVAFDIPGFRYTWLLGHEPTYRILESRPEHILPPEYEDWDTYLRGALESGLAGREPIPWGELNRARIRHPFSGIHPWLDARLNLPADPLHGWAGALRAQQSAYGQSLRFVGRPGMPEGARLQLPGGQSGHFLSPFYQAGHRAWVNGEPGPLMAGEARARLQFTPAPPLVR